MKVETVERASVSILALPHQGVYQEIGPKFHAIYQWAIANNAPLGPAAGIYYDDPKMTPVEELKSAAGIIIPESYEPPENNEGIYKTSMPAGFYLKVVHRGSYHGLYSTWMEFVDKVIPESGAVMNGPSFEIYLNSPDEVSEDELITELYQAIEAPK